MSKKLVKLGATIFFIITLFSQVCIPFIYADEVGDQTMKIEIEKKELDKTDTMKNVEYLENQWLIGYLNKDGNIEMYTSIGRERNGALLKILVYIGKIVVGYIYATVIDGIVIAATGKSGAEWVSIAIKNVVGRKYTGKVYLPEGGPYTCPGVVIDHSGMCGG